MYIIYLCFMDSLISYCFEFWHAINNKIAFFNRMLQYKLFVVDCRTLWSNLGSTVDCKEVNEVASFLFKHDHVPSAENLSVHVYNSIDSVISWLSWFPATWKVTILCSVSSPQKKCYSASCTKATPAKFKHESWSSTSYLHSSL